MSVVVKERDRERDWDRESYRDDRPRNVTVRRYKIADRDENERFETASHHTRRDRDDVREFRFERDTTRNRPDVEVDEYRSERPRSPEYRELRISRDISRDPPRSERERDPYELDHYTKTTDFYAREPDPRPIVIRQNAPQPIIIREEAPQPLIIHERQERQERPVSPRSVLLERQREEERQDRQSHVSRRTEIDRRTEERRTEPDRHTEVERHTEIGRRTEVDRRTPGNDDRTIAVREEAQPPARQEPEDEYYFQRRTRQIARDDRDDREDYRRRRDDTRSRRYDDQYSDDEYYYRKEVREYDGDRSRARSKSRHHLDVAEGAVAGISAAALMNHRNKKREDGKSGGFKNLAGGAVLGAVGGEVVNRARSRFRGGSESRSRSRSRSNERHGHSRRGRRHHSRSRSRSHSRSGSRQRIGDLGKLAGVAALGAIAGYAASRKRGNKNDDDRRSRSRVRRASLERSRSRSYDSYDTREERNPPNEALSSKKRNSTMAKAGLASAAVAGVVDRVRSKSRGGRSRSRVRQSLPIAAAGLGGAALAGLYENRKAKKEKESIDREEEHMSRSRSRPRDRSRPMSPYEENHGGLPAIEYGGAPIAPGEQYGRPRSRADSYYSDAGQGRRSLSSDSSSPRRQRHSSRSRNRNAEGAGGAGVAGMAAHDASQRRERKRAERERKRQEEAAQETPPGGPQAGFGFGPYGQEPPPNLPAQPEYPEHYFQNPNAYAPPNAYSPVPNIVNQQQHPQAQAPYGGAEGYPAPGTIPAQQPYGYPPGTQPGPYPGNHVSQVSCEAGPVSEDVKASSGSPVRREVNQKSARKSVQFNPNPVSSPSQGSTPELSPRSMARPDDSDQPMFDGNGDRETQVQNRDSGRCPPREHLRQSGKQRQAQSESSLDQRHDRRRDDPDDSGDTEDLPDRFDEKGRKLREQGEWRLEKAVREMMESAPPKSYTGRGTGNFPGRRNG